MENISLPGVTGSSSKPLDVGHTSQHPDADNGPASLSAKKQKSKGKKRGLELDSNTGKDTLQPRSWDVMRKKPKLHSSPELLTPTQAFRAPVDKSGLPREIWNYICLFLPPKTLGNLLCVNKLFNTYLDPLSSFAVSEPPPPLTQSMARAIDPNDIWCLSRRTFWHIIPGPFKDMTELEMWRLACSSTCQFCGKKDTRPYVPRTDPYWYGPGSDGVARIWEFQVRSCGPCFSKRTIKEMDLIMSTASTFLLPALQFVIANQDNIVIPLHFIESGKLSPTDVLSKLFWSADVEALREEFNYVKELGPAAADEWQKGLSSRGTQRQSEITKWLKQEKCGRVFRMRTCMYHVKKALRIASQEHGTLPAAEALPPVSGTAATQAVKTAPAACIETTASVALPKRPKEDRDAEWDEVQGPVRLKILKYADEAITGDWDHGKAVNISNAPSFAADVLLHVRRRFYTDVQKEAKAARAAGRQPLMDPRLGPFTQKLTLENMKYVFDVKIKPITGNLRKELFLCSHCDKIDKFYGIEGIIQHFAAKHTTTLSQGTTVVAWRSEWPAYTMFKANPRPPKGSTQLTLAAKPPTTRSAKNVQAKHGSQGAPHGQVDGQESNGPSQLMQHLPLPPAEAMAAAAFMYTTAPYYFDTSMSAMPFSETGAYLAGGPQEQIPFTYSQHSFQPQQQYAELPYHGAGYQATQDEQGVCGTSMRTDAAVSSGVAPAKSAVPKVRSAVTVLGGQANAHGTEKDVKLQLHAIATHADGLWRATTNISHLPPAVRYHTVFFHLNVIYKERFNKFLPLTLLTKALSTRKEMRPMLNVKTRMACKACYVSSGGAGADVAKAVKYPILDLLTHFKESHLLLERDGQPNRPSRDWLSDMLLLTGLDTLSKMVGHRGRKLPLLFESLQGMLPRQTEAVDEEEPTQIPRRDGVVMKQEQVAGNPEGAGGGRVQDVSQKDAVDVQRNVRESRVAIERKESSVLACNREKPVPPRQSAAARAAAPRASDGDLLSALEMHLDRGPAPRSKQGNDGGQHLAQHERHEMSHDVHAGAVSLDHRHGAVRPLADRRGQDVALRHEMNTLNDTAIQARAAQAQYRERSPLRARQDQYGAVYQYDSHGQHIPAQQQPPSAPAQDKYYVRAAMDYEYSDRHGEPATQAGPAAVGYDPYETYEVVQVVHPEGNYLARRPVRRPVAGPPYHRQAAPPVYTSARPAYEHEYYEEPPVYARTHAQAPGVYETAMHGRPEATHDGALAGPARTVAPSKPYYGEYGVHPVTEAARHWQGAPAREGGER